MKRDLRQWRRLANIALMFGLLFVFTRTAAAQGEQPDVNALDTVLSLIHI